MPIWRICVYRPEDRSDPIREWYAQQPLKVQLAFDATLRVLAGIRDWEDSEVGEFKALDRSHAGLGEVRFEIEEQQGKKRVKRKFRPVGLWPPVTAFEFILFAGCEKSGKVQIPQGAFDLALKYRKQFSQGRGDVDDYFK